MAYTTINDPTDYFNTKLYTGNGTAIGSGGLAVTGVGFQPDWVWLKNRTTGDRSHQVYDVIRGVTKGLKTNSSDEENTNSERLTAFGSDGFTVGNNGDVNTSGNAHVSWNWLASNTTASNTDGTITSTVSANTTSGFSIVSYTGTGANATVGHGLGVAPSFVIIKDRGNALSWVVSGDNIGWNKNMYLDVTQAVQTANHFQDTAPTSSLMYLSTDAAVNGSSRNYIMYCFAEKQGFSKMGSYTGNGSTDGPFVYTGFKPAFVITKRTDDASAWGLNDNKRPNYNPENLYLIANDPQAEASDGSWTMDFLSNGWKARYNNGNFNASGGSYIYMAFAEHPFVSSTGTPTTAR
jgi:hypothetical protein